MKPGDFLVYPKDLLVALPQVSVRQADQRRRGERNARCLA